MLHRTLLNLLRKDKKKVTMDEEDVRKAFVNAASAIILGNRGNKDVYKISKDTITYTVDGNTVELVYTEDGTISASVMIIDTPWTHILDSEEVRNLYVLSKILDDDMDEIRKYYLDLNVMNLILKMFEEFTDQRYREIKDESRHAIMKTYLEIEKIKSRYHAD